ncbi:MAG: hypothetical protein K2F79_07585 [Muribaculaceae bacterium]|nr:hypothetical protein [Muribaculaceae bacterium]
MPVPSYATLILRKRLSRHMPAMWVALVLLAILLSLSGPRVAMAAAFLGMGVCVYVWGRTWVDICRQPVPIEWLLRPEWHPDPRQGVILSVDFYDTAGDVLEDSGNQDEDSKEGDNEVPATPLSHLEISPADIRKTTMHGSYIVIYLYRSPYMLIVPTRELENEFISRLLQ